MRIVGVNGIATHGHGNIDVLLHRLDQLGHETVDVQLRKRHFISAWWGQKWDVESIYKASEDGDVVVAHSFGAPRVVEAMKYRHFSKVFLIRPAMSAKHVFARDEVYCFHSKDDWPVRIGSWLPWHPFGRAGVDGFTDPLVTNFPTSGGHNADFTTYLHQTVTYIADRLTD
ncbi:MAG: hypothetical protein NXH95_13635 [Pseudomonadaceae bacterium]|nr:hypothetical protein [Pseudomonadaceae bacterium]